MLALLYYIASQTLRGTLYIVFMLTLQHILHKRLSPRVRAFLWAPLLFVLFAPNLCVVRVPVSQPVETTVVDALEQTRIALTSDVVKSAPEFGLRRVDGRDVVYLPPSPLEIGPFKTVAPPFGASADEENWNDEEDVWASETNEAPDAALVDAALDVSSEKPQAPEVADEAFAETTPTPETAEAAETPAPTFETFFEQPLEATLALAASPTPANAVETESASLDKTPEVAASSQAVVRSGWFRFFEIAAIVFVAVWALGLVVALVYLVRSTRVCRRWVRLSAPVDDADVLALYRRCADSLEISEPPRLATTIDLSSPAFLGWRRPVVLVPSEYLDDLSEERLTHVLLHELGHFKRGDATTGFLAFLVLATHWFNPFFWLAARSFHATREEACDAIALGSTVLTNANSAAEYARTLCEIAGRRPFVEQAFGAVGFSSTFRSLRRRVETLGRFGTWGRRAAIGCLLASLVAAAFATVRLLPDVEKVEETKAISDEAVAAVRQKARDAFAALPAFPKGPVPTIAPTDPIAAVDVATLYQDEADRLFFGHSTEERQAFCADAVAKIRSAKEQGEAEYYAALGDYLVRESAFFWLLAGVDAGFRADAEGAPLAESVSSVELDAALARAEKTADPNFRYLAELHRALFDQAKRERPAEYRDGCAEPLGERVRSPFWRKQLKPRPCRALDRELETGLCFLVEAAAQGNGDASASLARYVENGFADELTPSGLVAEAAFLYALAGAEAGSPQAQGLVASYYARGFGVERNVAEALRWGERFYEADVATGPSNFYPGLWYARRPGYLRPIVPKTLDELNTIEARLLRRLAPIDDTLSFNPFELRTGDVAPGAPLARRLFLESCACDFGRGPSQNDGPKSRATFLLLAEAALDSEPTPETLALAEKFLRRANDCEELSIFHQTETPDGRVIKLDDDVYRETPGFVEANERLAEIFETGSFGVQDDAKAREFRNFAFTFGIDRKHGRPAGYILHLDPANDVPALVQEPEETPADVATAGARPSFVAPETPEFEAVIAPIFAKLEKTLVDAKNGNADALSARFNEYFDDATDLYPNGRPGAPEVARYKVERLTKEIERLEQNNGAPETLDRLRERRDSWNRLASA